MKILKTTIIGIAIILVITWIAGAVIAPEKNPEPQYKGTIVSQKADEILRKSCFDCHSNETVWPWYSNVPPMSLLVNFDVKEGREHLNFSEWETMSMDDKMEALEESLEEAEEGEMPLPPYLITHPDAKLTSEQMAILKADIEAIIGKSGGEKRNREEGEEDDDD